MSLEISLYLLCESAADATPTKMQVLDALTGRFSEAEQRLWIEASGAARTAFADLQWLHDGGGAATLLDVPLGATMVPMRRVNEAPLFVRPLDVIRRFVSNGWVGERDRASLPPAALDAGQLTRGVRVRRHVPTVRSPRHASLAAPPL